MAFNCRIIKHALSSRQSGERPWTVCRKLVFSNQPMGVPGCSRTLGYRGATGIASTDRQLPSLARPTPTLSFPSSRFLARRSFQLVKYGPTLHLSYDAS